MLGGRKKNKRNADLMINLQKKFPLTGYLWWNEQKFNQSFGLIGSLFIEIRLCHGRVKIESLVWYLVNYKLRAKCVM